MSFQRNKLMTLGGFTIVSTFMCIFALTLGCTKSQTKSMNTTVVDSGRMGNESENSMTTDGGLAGDMETVVARDQSLNRDRSVSADAVDETEASSDGGMSPNRDRSVADNATDAMVERDVIESDMGNPSNRSEISGQCAQNEDCPEGNENGGCNRFIPGGSCFGCLDDEDCPGTAECNLGYGTCITPCDDDTSCPPGLRCTVAGRCGAVRCENGQCPDQRFGCSGSGQCERISCVDETSCPRGTVCLEGLCVLSSWRQSDAEQQ